MNQIWAILFLVVCTITDLQKRMIYVWICSANFFVALLVKGVIRDIHFLSVFAGLAVAGIIWLISFLSKEAIGKGDVMIIASLTAVLEFKQIINMLFIGLALCSIFSVVALAAKKLTSKSSVPFVPFLLLGEICNIFIGG